VQAKLNREISQGELQEFFLDAYADAPFVEIVSEMPKLKDVVASNYCHIGIAASGDTVVVTSAIDNLVKGAAGGAMQWMNRLWDLPETTGLGAPSPAWT
jgi:N-acetyl-gamma-glutamyl-phosphate reductase